jgi:hypothetical protein
MRPPDRFALEHRAANMIRTGALPVTDRGRGLASSWQATFDGCPSRRNPAIVSVAMKIKTKLRAGPGCQGL